jgi:hypothetical protein
VARPVGLKVATGQEDYLPPEIYGEILFCRSISFTALFSSEKQDWQDFFVANITNFIILY